MTKVLIIDDSKIMQKLVSKVVQDLGGEIVAYGNDGEEGVTLFKKLSPDLTLLDITMPNKDGRQCLKEILMSNPKANVVILSSLNSPEVIQECLALGAKAFVDKGKMGQQEEVSVQLRPFFKAKAA